MFKQLKSKMAKKVTQNGEKVPSQGVNQSERKLIAEFQKAEQQMAKNFTEFHKAES